VLARLRAGEVVAVVTDAGMPGISDPGERLVRAAAQSGSRCGWCRGPRPPSRASWRAACRRVGSSSRASSHARAPAARAAWRRWPPRSARSCSTRRPPAGADDRRPRRRLGGERRVAIARELTKLHEEVWRGTLAEAVARVAEVEPRGEHVVVVEGAPEPDVVDDDDIRAAIAGRLAAGSSRRDAVAEVAAGLGVARRRVYDLALDAPELTRAARPVDGITPRCRTPSSCCAHGTRARRRRRGARGRRRGARRPARPVREPVTRSPRGRRRRH
jgi:16S rRNA (cytidine1402-2'-O)-methyltransferase